MATRSAQLADLDRPMAASIPSARAPPIVASRRTSAAGRLVASPVPPWMARPLCRSAARRAAPRRSRSLELAGPSVPSATFAPAPSSSGIAGQTRPELHVRSRTVRHRGAGRRDRLDLAVGEMHPVGRSPCGVRAGRVTRGPRPVGRRASTGPGRPRPRSRRRGRGGRHRGRASSPTSRSRSGDTVYVEWGPMTGRQPGPTGCGRANPRPTRQRAPDPSRAGPIPSRKTGPVSRRNPTSSAAVSAASAKKYMSSAVVVPADTDSTAAARVASRTRSEVRTAASTGNNRSRNAERDVVDEPPEHRHGEVRVGVDQAGDECVAGQSPRQVQVPPGRPPLGPDRRRRSDRPPIATAPSGITDARHRPDRPSVSTQPATSEVGRRVRTSGSDHPGGDVGVHRPTLPRNAALDDLRQARAGPLRHHLVATEARRTPGPVDVRHGCAPTRRRSSGSSTSITPARRRRRTGHRHRRRTPPDRGGGRRLPRRRRATDRIERCTRLDRAAARQSDG